MELGGLDTLARRLEGDASLVARVEAHAGTLELSFEEWFALNEQRAMAQASGLLSTEDSMTLYRWLGSSYTPGSGWPALTTALERYLAVEAMGAVVQTLQASRNAAIARN